MKFRFIIEIEVEDEKQLRQVIDYWLENKSNEDVISKLVEVSLNEFPKYSFMKLTSIEGVGNEQ